MEYLCLKQITVGGTTYNPGNVIPDGVIMPERSTKLIRNGYISKADKLEHKENQDNLFTQEQVDKMLAEAIEEAVNNTIAEMEQKQKELQKVLQQSAAELKEFDSEVFVDTVIIDIAMDSGEGNEQHMAIPANPEEIQRVFAIMQLNADEGAKAIAEVKSENVLILLHAADSRKTIKNAAKDRADKLFSNKAETNAPIACNEYTDTMEGAGT